MGDYKLYRAPEGYDGPGWGEPKGSYPTLIDAMKAAGHPNPADWYTTVGIPETISVDWTLYFDPKREYEDTEYLTLPWTIEAPDVAAEYTNLLVPDDPSSLMKAGG